MSFKTRLSVKVKALAFSSLLCGSLSLKAEVYESQEWSTAENQFTTFGSSINDNKYPNHFTVNDIAHDFSDAEYRSFQNPLELMSQYEQELVSSVALSLVDWVEHRVPVPVPRKPYDRKGDFGVWQKDRTGNSCLDVRGMILEKHSLVPVKTKPSMDRCVVYSGQWLDPYSGKTFNRPYPEIEIDHFVPLKNVYLMGAANWPSKKKCWYYNFHKNDYHLIPVSAHENERKGDATPFDYLPPKDDYLCSYVKNWLKIKMIWKLALVPPEVDAIEKVIRKHRCSAASLKISEAELKRQRALIEAGSPLCD